MLSKPLVAHLSIVIFVEWFGAGKEWVVAAMAIPYAIPVRYGHHSGRGDHDQRHGGCMFNKRKLEVTTTHLKAKKKANLANCLSRHFVGTDCLITLEIEPYHCFNCDNYFHL